MTFSDIFKKSFLNGFTSSDINIYTASSAMLITSLLAVYIFFLYRILVRKTFYSKTFGVSLAGVALIVSGIIITIQSSIVVSLGMVGALSIVRFRTAVKDPMDLMFLFWAIAVGIICGVGMGEIAIILSIILTFLILLLDHFPIAKSPMLLVINSSDIHSETEIMNIVNKYSKHVTIKSRNIVKTSLDIVIELRTNLGSELINEIISINSVENASLMSHDGETTF